MLLLDPLSRRLVVEAKASAAIFSKCATDARRRWWWGGVDRTVVRLRGGASSTAFGDGAAYWALSVRRNIELLLFFAHYSQYNREIDADKLLQPLMLFCREFWARSC